MKKSFPALLLTALLFAFGALPATIHAEETQHAATNAEKPQTEATSAGETLPAATDAEKPQPAVSPERLEEAKQYCIESMITGLKVGIRIGGTRELSPQQIDNARKLIDAWINGDLIPFLSENGALEEWVSIQFDPELREINQKAANSKTIDEVMKAANEAFNLMSTRYSDFNSKVNTPQGVQVMQKRQNILMQVITDTEE